MTSIDYILAGIVLVSALLSFIRGFLREAFSLVSWVIAFWCAFSFSGLLSEPLEDIITNPSMRAIISAIAVFFIAMIITSLTFRLIIQLIGKRDISGIDRMLGALFGAGRGVVMITVLVFLAGLTPLIEETWWQDSKFIENLESVILWASETLSEGDLP